MSIFEQTLEKDPANFEALTPVSFLRRAAQVAPEHCAVIHGQRRYTYAQFWERSCRLASALASRGIGHGDCVAIMGANTPEMLEAHNAVPMLGGV
ncbi:MAG TPA: AMP-binding protein, partial [Arenicellales bacterium]|nr:AMP-binding protein [Arenicellales bacterium]